MGWSFRKSAKFGPFRINLSKSGVGYSFGIKGARISSNTKGTYVTFGAKGIYYRKKINHSPSESLQRKESRISPTVHQPETPHTITSANIEQLTDSDSKDFIDELTEKSKKISFLKWFGILPAILFCIIFFSSLNFNTHPTIFLMFFLAAIIGFAFLFNFLYKKDRERLQIEIQYEIDDKVKEIYDNFIALFSEITATSRVWQYLHAQRTFNYKYNSGANQLINRIRIQSIFTDKKPERFFKTNVQIPNIKLQNTDMYFFPERLVIKRNGKFAAVFYKNLSIQASTTKFIESEDVSQDAKIVDYTWRYLNKNGTPDRRFNNNFQIPICLYSQYSIESETGVFEIICTSKLGAFDNFSKIIEAIGALQKRIPSFNQH